MGKVRSINDTKGNKEVNNKEEMIEKVMTEFSEEELSKAVTRGEIIDLMGQVSENINEISKYLMEDVNVHFRQYTYPLMIKQQALINLLINKEIFSESEFNSEVKEISQKLVENAKEVQSQSQEQNK